MNILLINPPNCVPKEWKFPVHVFQPMGLAYIAANLEKNHYKPIILDALASGWENEFVKDNLLYTGLSDDDILSKIIEFKPDVVGITAPFTSQIKNVFNVASIVKKVNKKIVVVVGGPHPTIQPEQTLACSDIDYVIRGEGEYSFLDFTKKTEAKSDITTVKGLAYRVNGTIVKNDIEFIEDIDSLPYPAWHLLPMDKYFEAANKIKASRSISTYKKRWATIITSRGCPYKCIFCSIKPTMGHKWRSRSPEKVITEIEYLINRYKIQHIDFEDDNLTLDKNRAEKIFEMMIEKNFDIEWSTPNGVMAQTLDENILLKMKKSGCKRIVFAPESGVQRVLKDIIRKSIDLNKIVDAVKWCKKHKLLVECFFVIGFPGETKNDILESIDFAKYLRKLGVDECSFYIATPFYGTELYNIAKQKGYLRDIFGDEGLNTLSGEPLIETEDFTVEELKQLWKKANEVNSFISYGRIKLALNMFLVDPKRAFKLAYERVFYSKR